MSAMTGKHLVTNIPSVAVFTTLAVAAALLLAGVDSSPSGFYHSNTSPYRNRVDVQHHRRQSPLFQQLLPIAQQQHQPSHRQQHYHNNNIHQQQHYRNQHQRGGSGGGGGGGVFYAMAVPGGPSVIPPKTPPSSSSAGEKDYSPAIYVSHFAKVYQSMRRSGRSLRDAVVSARRDLRAKGLAPWIWIDGETRRVEDDDDGPAARPQSATSTSYHRQQHNRDHQHRYPPSLPSPLSRNVAPVAVVASTPRTAPASVGGVHHHLGPAYGGYQVAGHQVSASGGPAGADVNSVFQEYSRYVDESINLGASHAQKAFGLQFGHAAAEEQQAQPSPNPAPAAPYQAYQPQQHQPQHYQHHPRPADVNYNYPYYNNGAHHAAGVGGVRARVAKRESESGSRERDNDDDSGEYVGDGRRPPSQSSSSPAVHIADTVHGGGGGGRESPF